jgi:RNA polymerase sigma factor (sigma-70 family)
MATRRPPGDAEHQLAVQKVFDAVFDFAWRALARYGLSRADRDDLAQSAAIAALRRWPTYREASGTPGQWLRGIVRNELRAFRRAQARLPLPAGEALADVPAKDPTPEHRAAAIHLADRLLSILPVEQRRVVILHDLAGLTYREIAVVEGISKSEAHERHRDAMVTLAAAVARLDDRELRGVLPVPFSLASLYGRDAAGPSAAARAEARQRAAGELGAVPRPRSLRRPTSLRRVASAVAGALLASLVAVPTLERCGRHTPPRPAGPVVAASAKEAPSPEGSAPHPSPAAGPTPEDGGGAGALPVAPRETAPRPAPPAADAGAASDPEMILLDRAHAALVSEKYELALDALDLHASRYPEGELTVTREQTRRLTCARAAAVGVTVRRCAPRAPSRPGP